MSSSWALPKGKVAPLEWPLPHLQCGDHMASSGATVEGWQPPPCTLWPAHSLPALGSLRHPSLGPVNPAPSCHLPSGHLGQRFRYYPSSSSSTVLSPQHPGLPSLPGLSLEGNSTALGVKETRTLKKGPSLWKMSPLERCSRHLAPPSSCPGWLQTPRLQTQTLFSNS